MLGRMWRTFCSRQANFLPNYVVYHYLRSKGWVPKKGAKYGADFGKYFAQCCLTFGAGLDTEKAKRM